MVYLDFNASTPVDSRVLDLMSNIGVEAVNPGSIQHSSGRKSKQLVDESREHIAELLDVNPQEILFTSGASEGISIALLGFLAGLPEEKRRVLTISTEHKAVLQTLTIAQSLLGAQVNIMPVDSDGVVDWDEIGQLSQSQNYSVLTVMHSNNETGVLQPFEEFTQMGNTECKIFMDCTQSIGKVDLGSYFQVADMAVLSAHKFYGPKGVGVLKISRDLQKLIMPLFAGGGQERGLRGGTQNVPGIAGMALALKNALNDQRQFSENSRYLSKKFLSILDVAEIDYRVIGANATRLTNTLNIRFLGVEAEMLMTHVPEIEVSTGSACNSAVVEPSHVLLAHGLSVTEANECIRFSFGKTTTIHDIEYVGNRVASAVRHILERDLVEVQ